MIKRYFVDVGGRIMGEVFTETPANPSGLQIIQIEELVNSTEYVWDGAAVIHSPIGVAPILPSACTRRQGRLALLNAGKLDAVEVAIEAIADPTAKRQAQIEYEADTWERSNAFLQSMWVSLGGTEAELDALFTLAVTL